MERDIGISIELGQLIDHKSPAERFHVTSVHKSASAVAENR